MTYRVDQNENRFGEHSTFRRIFRGGLEVIRAGHALNWIRSQSEIVAVACLVWQQVQNLLAYEIPRKD